MVKSSTRLQRKLAKKAPFINQEGQEHEGMDSKHDSVNTMAHDSSTGTTTSAVTGSKAQRDKQGQRSLQRKAKKEPVQHQPQQQQKKKVKRRDNTISTATGSATPTAISRSDQTRKTKKMSNQISDQHRRVAEKLVAREQQQHARLTAAEARMEAAKAELALFDQVTQIPSFVENPFLAIEGHLNDTMTCLQPQTPDVGRAKREE
ncbi:uncharacterized protein TM35_000391540 [Trypanosoma theileri]|uniref:Uncharacterized protein n=1 Tax=Trypanosoma theileri TaxID=67003 RepID=A0A1X0NLJ3_9TRYP|nr:uncharacterized protein TM35_000391540 [Trypanosoma theileri]ORC84980.1 hypothetical protein TM35_000391540 [Trypanosoma theileri]